MFMSLVYPTAEKELQGRILFACLLMVVSRQYVCALARNLCEAINDSFGLSNGLEFVTCNTSFKLCFIVNYLPLVHSFRTVDIRLMLL